MNTLNTSHKVALLFALLLTSIVGSNTYASTASSHHHIKQFIVDEANRQGVDAALALAIAKTESNFKSDALSSAGAKGIMQIMPATAEKEFGVSRYRLFNAKTNVRLGIRFIKQLLNAYGQRVDIALSHYNGGSAVRGKHGRLSVIPATKGYVRKVLLAREQFDSEVHQFLAEPNMLTTPTMLANRSISNFDKTTTVYAKRIAALDDFPTLMQNYNEDETKVSEPIDSKQYTRIENIQKLRLHNIERNFKMSPNTLSKRNVVKKRLINHSLVSNDSKNLPQILSDNSKRQKVLKWERIFN